MSILLEPRSQSREKSEQPFFSGNASSSSAWGRTAPDQMRFFWEEQQPSSSKATSFSFTAPRPPPRNTLAPQNSHKVFVFGSKDHTVPPGNGNGYKNGKDSATAGYHYASDAYQNGMDDWRPTRDVDQVGTMLHTMQLGPDPPFKAEKVTTKFAVGVGGTPSDVPSPPTVNPRPRFSKLRKSSHTSKGKGVSGGASGTSGTTDGRSSSESASGGGTGLSGQSFTFNSRASSEDGEHHGFSEFLGEDILLRKRDQNDPSAGYQHFVVDDRKGDGRKQGDAGTTRAGPQSEEPFQFGATTSSTTQAGSTTGTQTGSTTTSQSGARTTASQAGSTIGTQTGSTTGTSDPRRAHADVFTFRSMRDVPPISGVYEEQPLDEDGNLVAPKFRAMHLEEEAEKKIGSSETSVPPAQPQQSSSFVFTAGLQTPTRPDAAPGFTFVFKTPGADGAPVPPIRKKKDKPKKTPKSKFRTPSQAGGDGQGSPMDFSPCPDTGAQLSGNNSEDGWNAQFDSYSIASDLMVDEMLAELSLGKDEEPRPQGANPVNPAPQPSSGSVPFAFTANTTTGSVTTASTRRSRRVPKVTKTSAPSVPPRAEPVNQVPEPVPPPAAATENPCEKWRLRGNQAYANGDFPKAEEYYSRGASSVAPNDTSESSIRASMLCYSNRAATRMAVGRMREALADCSRAMAVDPGFLRVQLRAGSCHLALGEIEAAISYFRECVRRATDPQDKYDPKLASEAADGLTKCEQVTEQFKLLNEALSADSTTAMRHLNQILVSAPYSEMLLEYKAQCLLNARDFEEVVSLCDQTQVLAEQNWGLDSQAASQCRAWRSWMVAKSTYHLGRIEEALEGLQKLGEHMILAGSSVVSRVMGADMNSLSQFTILAHDLLRHKAAGNEAFQAGRHAEAVEHYTAALACNGESRPFNAVLFCNRAAASQLLGNVADAIADCSRAVVLDPKYAKAISRRATLHSSIRDYGQACTDLRRMISLCEDKGKESKRSTASQQELKQARERLTAAEDEIRRNYPIDHYLVLGLQPSCSPVEVKKAYRKLALRHHPDKSGSLLVRNESVDDGNLWKEVGEEIRHDAERLFKLIGEAYAILSDPSKRAKYDETRFRNGSSSSSNSETYKYHHERTSSGRRRDRWDSYSGYSHQHQHPRWQNGPDPAQPDTYAHHGRHWRQSKFDDFSWDDI